MDDLVRYFGAHWRKIPIRGRQTAEVLHFMTDDDVHQCLSLTVESKLAA